MEPGGIPYPITGNRTARNRRAYNGYFIGVLGPGLLYEGMRFPFLPPCDWRNLDNPTLSDRSWFERPCDEFDPSAGLHPD